LEEPVPSAAKLLGKPTALARAGYLLAVLIGAYGFTWVATGFGASALLYLGLERSEAVIVATLLGFVLYPAAALYLFAARRPLRVCGLLLVASAVLLAARHLLGAG